MPAPIRLLPSMSSLQPLRPRKPLLPLLAWLCLSACGGGGSASGAAATAADALLPAVATALPATGAAAADAAGAAVAQPVAATPTLTPTPTPLPQTGPAQPAALPALRAPVLPRASLDATDLAVLIAEGDPLSEAIGLAYQRARGIPDAQVLRLPVPAGSDAISAADFGLLKARIDAALPARVQATLVTWRQPSRVQGSCAMGLTSALAFGYDPAYCGGCNRTQASAYYDSDSTRPYTDLQLRPSMMLGAATLAEAEALIARGLAADGSAPTGTGHLLRTADAARSVRAAEYPALVAAWSTAPGLDLRYLDASAAGSAQALTGQDGLLFYFTGLARVPQLASNRFLPGAAADHLTSFGGALPSGNGQMPVTDWLAAGATASYGTVEEPCNHLQKFSRASVLIDQYLRGATLIEAYWKSVAWPGQGLFVGDPLARPWSQPPGAAIEDGSLVLRTRSLRRGGAYRVEYRSAAAVAAAAGSADGGWTTLDRLTAGQPQPLTWRMPLPADSAGGQLRWIGPCPTQTGQSCVLGSAS